MKQACLYSALGGAVGATILGIGFVLLTEFPPDFQLPLGDRVIDLSAWSRAPMLLILPFTLAGAALGVFSAGVFFFGSCELDHFSEPVRGGFEAHRQPILWMALAGGLVGLLLAGGVPISPGLYPIFYVDDPGSGLERVYPGEARGAGQRVFTELSPENQWRVLEVLQSKALEGRSGARAAFQRRFTGVFFALLPAIQAAALFAFGATITGWSALICATFLFSRRAGGELAFWSLWLLFTGFSLGIVAIGGFGYAFQAFGEDSSADLYVYSIFNAGVPGAWIVFAAVAGNTFGGLFGLANPWRSLFAGGVATVNAYTVLTLGTTTRFIHVVNPPIRDGEGLALEFAAPVWNVLTYFEGRLVDPDMMVFPSAPLAAIVTAFGLGLGLAGACYGTNVSLGGLRKPGSFQQTDS